MFTNEQQQGDPFHKQFKSSSSKSRKNTCCFYMKRGDLIRSQFCTCHDSSALVTCAKLGPDWIIWIKIRKLELNKFSQRFQSQALGPFGDEFQASSGKIQISFIQNNLAQHWRKWQGWWQGQNLWLIFHHLDYIFGTKHIKVITHSTKSLISVMKKFFNKHCNITCA